MQDPLLGPLIHGVGLGILFPLIFLVFVVWTFAWKAIALWHAGRNGQRIWFIALLLINSIGILEIVYLKWFQADDNKGDRKDMFPFIKDVRGKVSAQMSSSSAPIDSEKKPE